MRKIIPMTFYSILYVLSTYAYALPASSSEITPTIAVVKIKYQESTEKVFGNEIVLQNKFYGNSIVRRDFNVSTKGVSNDGAMNTLGSQLKKTNEKTYGSTIVGRVAAPLGLETILGNGKDFSELSASKVIHLGGFLQAYDNVVRLRTTGRHQSTSESIPVIYWFIGALLLGIWGLASRRRISKN
jgi:hypothetical protein